MKTLLRVLPFLGVLAACSRGPETPRVDEALRQDLSLASQMQPYAPQPYMSPIEMGYDAYGRPVYANPQYQVPGAYYPAPTPVVTRPAPAERVIRRAPASAPRPVVYETKTNTKRDAIIGAAAGAVIGAATSSSKDRLKGAVIGAAAGGVLGAIYGQKVDVQKIPR